MKNFIHITLFILLCINEYTFINAMPAEKNAPNGQQDRSDRSSKKRSRDDEHNNNNNGNNNENEFEQYSCSICSEEMDDGDTRSRVRTLHCGHTFHRTCINNWFLKNPNKRSCPLCRVLYPVTQAQKNLARDLLNAIMTDNIDAATTLLNNQDIEVNAQDEHGNGCTALHLAVIKGNFDIITLLLDQGANINAQGKQGFTALYLAAGLGSLDIVTLLLGQGADINTQTDTGYTALTISVHLASAISIPTVQAYIQNNDNCMALFRATSKIAAVLLTKGADATLRSNTGETALDIAQANGNPEMIQLLTQATTPN